MAFELDSEEELKTPVKDELCVQATAQKATSLNTGEMWCLSMVGNGSGKPCYRRTNLWKEKSRVLCALSMRALRSVLKEEDKCATQKKRQLDIYSPCVRRISRVLREKDKILPNKTKQYNAFLAMLQNQQTFPSYYCPVGEIRFSFSFLNTYFAFHCLLNSKFAFFSKY